MIHLITCELRKFQFVCILKGNAVLNFLFLIITGHICKKLFKVKIYSYSDYLQKPTGDTDDTSDDQVDSELTSADSTPVKTGSVSSNIVDGGVIPETATSNIDAKVAEPTISPSE